jgi:hypothetical protein
MRNPIASLIDDGRLFHMPMVVPTTSATARRYREISLGLATSDAVSIWGRAAQVGVTTQRRWCALVARQS